MRPVAADFHLLNPDCMTAAIRAITELSVELKFNDRFGCPRNAMWVCVMIWGFISESHNKRHLLENEDDSAETVRSTEKCGPLHSLLLRKKKEMWHFDSILVIPYQNVKVMAVVIRLIQVWQVIEI